MTLPPPFSVIKHYVLKNLKNFVDVKTVKDFFLHTLKIIIIIAFLIPATANDISPKETTEQLLLGNSDFWGPWKI